MKVKWLGHASFLITSAAGVRIITDPYPQGSGLSYVPINEAADVVTVSHDHFDHNNVSSIPGHPQIITGRDAKNIKGIEFKGLSTYHDSLQGKERGANTIFCFLVDGIKVCHLGDLGHRLSKEQIAELGDIDILLIPIGGVFTIDAKSATVVVDDLKPKVVMPMHYKTTKCDWTLSPVDDFIVDKKNVRKLNSSEVEFKAETLPDSTEIIVLEPAS
jgi:L-ascorbate metabolism protein UlaG (beta-lactamase superfamily)